ncbi:MAG: hypothetical protein ACP5R5_00265 [Armatimonadota bacterium]
MRIINREHTVKRVLIGQAVLLAVCLTAAPVPCRQSFSRTGVSIQTRPGGVITLFDSLSRVEAVGGVHIEAVNKPARTTLVADADKMTVVRFSDPKKAGALQGMDSIKSAMFTGSVKLVFTGPKRVGAGSGESAREVMTTTTATADSAGFDGTTGIVTLTGHVKIIQDDPSMWAEPAVMTGDKAMINLRRKPGTEDFDFRIESTTGPSRIEVVPKGES